MIRPEPPNANAAHEASRFWTAQHAGPGKIFSVGAVVNFQANQPPAASPFPHATEDRIVAGGSKLVSTATHAPVRLAELAAASVSGSLGDIFDDRLVRAYSGKAHVAAGERVASLGAVEIDPADIRFHEELNGKGQRKLRAWISEGGVEYDLSVPADAPRDLFLKRGADAVQAEMRACRRLHVRIGLCRPFPAMPDACYAQINGLYPL